MAKSPRLPGHEGLKASLGTALKADRRRRDANAVRQATQARSNKRRQDKAVAAVDRIQVNSIVSPERRQHGDYHAVDFKLVEVTEGGKRKEKTQKVVRNLSSTVVERWNTKGAFDERQWQAIIKYISLHCAAFGPGQRVTANYSPAIARGGHGTTEAANNRALDAMGILRLLDNEVFFREPPEHFWIWQNVLIFDEPAGIAGSRCGYSHKGAEAVAREVVRSLAWKVADLLVDQPLPRDFRDMLIDLDASRRPGRRG
jgi:RNA 3'-terminal phosphate cyclase